MNFYFYFLVVSIEIIEWLNYQLLSKNAQSGCMFFLQPCYMWKILRQFLFLFLLYIYIYIKHVVVRIVNIKYKVIRNNIFLFPYENSKIFFLIKYIAQSYFLASSTLSVIVTIETTMCLTSSIRLIWLLSYYL